MSNLPSLAPHPALSEHPEFAFMVARTLERFHCTLAEIREDYWLSRAWRALVADVTLRGRVARIGVGSVLVTGPRFGPAPRELDHCAALLLRVQQRIFADTAHHADHLGIKVRFAEEQVDVADGCLLSLIAQTVADDDRWMDLAPYADDLAPVVVPVAFAVGRIAAA